MKEYLSDRIRVLSDPLKGRSFLREYLQARILGFLQDSGAMVPLAFHGGTCLRLLYMIPRYSEDLDFALERKSSPYDLRSYMGKIERGFAAEGYEVAFRINDSKIVHSCFVRFPSLLHELGLSPQRTEALSVKIEVDTRPPAGARCYTTLVRRHVTLNLHHHDKASLLAGKLHAILQRKFTKGRDLFDLLWYLSDPSWPDPNLEMLGNALAQTGWKGPIPTSDNWRELIACRCEKADWKQALADVSPFVEREDELRLLNPENILKLLRR